MMLTRTVLALMLLGQASAAFAVPAATVSSVSRFAPRDLAGRPSLEADRQAAVVSAEVPPPIALRWAIYQRGAAIFGQE